MWDRSLSVFVPNPSVARRYPAENSFTPLVPMIRFQPPLTESSPETYEPSKKPHFAGPAVISDPYWLELHVRTVPQKELLPVGRPSRRTRWLKRGLLEVSWRVKLDALFALVLFGNGSRFSSARAFLSSRSVGMTFPGKHPGPPAVTLQAPVDCGSLMNISRLLASSV